MVRIKFSRLRNGEKYPRKWSNNPPKRNTTQNTTCCLNDLEKRNAERNGVIRYNNPIRGKKYKCIIDADNTVLITNNGVIV